MKGLDVNVMSCSSPTQEEGGDSQTFASLVERDLHDYQYQYQFTITMYQTFLTKKLIYL